MAKTTEQLALNGAMSNFKIRPSTNEPSNPMGAFSYNPPSSIGTISGAMGSFALRSSARNKIISAKIATAQRDKPSNKSSPSSYTAVKRSRFGVPFNSWTTFKWTADTKPEPIDFRLAPNSGYRFTSPHYDQLGSLATFQNAYALRSCVCIKLNIDDTDRLHTRIPVLHHAAMAHAVYCSNFIKQVGATESITSKICHRVFAGEDVVAEDITGRVDNLQEHLKCLIPATKERTIENVVLSRREIIQHAKALAHIVDAMVNDHTPLTESLILETHRILVTGLDNHNQEGQRTHPWRFYAGRYRRGEEHVMAGTTNFVAPSCVSKAMADLCSQFEDEVKAFETKGTIDPIFLAARYCQEFVMIHPFLDGNGRMCRLILNAVLMKYMGSVVGIGGREEERKEYLATCRRAGEEMEGAGELAGLVLGKVEEEMDRMNEKIDYE